MDREASVPLQFKEFQVSVNQHLSGVCEGGCVRVGRGGGWRESTVQQ